LGVGSWEFNVLRFIALISGLYDIVVGVSLTAGRPLLMSLFQLPAPVPPIHADLNALFVTTVGIGYWWPYRDPVAYRWYLWLMGPLLKGAGAATFIADHLLRGSPRSFLLFAVCDGTLAILTFWALVREQPTASGTSNRPVSQAPR
jgi:uncharacterized membrane protein YfcA